VIFLETAELRVKDRVNITVKFWKENIDKILEFNNRQLLDGRGKISKKMMEGKVNTIYSKFEERRKVFDAKQADEDDLSELKQLEGQLKNRDNG
jgi:hypothetical protein